MPSIASTENVLVADGRGEADGNGLQKNAPPFTRSDPFNCARLHLHEKLLPYKAPHCITPSNKSEVYKAQLIWWNVTPVA